MQPLLSHRAAKQRRRADRIVIECQEQAYWLVNRPSVSGRRRGLAAPTMITSVLSQGKSGQDLHRSSWLSLF